MAKERAPLNTRDPYAGYSSVSLALHWLTAIFVIALFLTHEGRELRPWHIGLGLVATPLFVLRLGWRFAFGFPRVPDQAAALNLLSRLVQIGFIVCILLVTITGLVIPPLKGQPLDFFGMTQFPIPFPQDRGVAEWLEEVHSLAGDAFLPLFVLHVAGALKHHFLDRDTVLTRMLKSVPKGK